MVRAALAAVIALSVVVASAALAGTRQESAVQRATVTITDSTLVVSPTSLQTGVATFVAVNKGRRPHGFAILGPALSLRTAKLAAGRSARLTVLLHAGSYRLWDPVGLGRTKARSLQVKTPPPPKVDRIVLPRGELGPTYSCEDDMDDIQC